MVIRSYPAVYPCLKENYSFYKISYFSDDFFNIEAILLLREGGLSISSSDPKPRKSLSNSKLGTTFMEKVIPFY
jgi:hypothetical protein